MQDLDHYIKETLGAAHYIRYMDDMVVFGSNKKKLHQIRRAIQSYLETELGLNLKENWQVFRFDYIDRYGNHRGRFLDFMGFRFYRDRTTLRRTIWYKACRKARKIAKKDGMTVYDCKQMLAYLGWLDCTDTYDGYLERIKPYVSFKRLKRRVSTVDRQKGRKQHVDESFCGRKAA